MRFLRTAAGAILCLTAQAEDLSPEQLKLHLESFEHVWKTIHDKHFDPEHLKKVGWDAVRAEFRPKAESAKSGGEVRAAMNGMIERLGQTHFGIVPSGLYDRLDSKAGGGGATTGIEVRVLGQEAVVARIDPGSTAEMAGVKPGWVIRSVNGTKLAPAIAEITKAFSKSTLFDIAASRAIEGMLSGAAGSVATVEFEDVSGAAGNTAISRVAPRGAIATFGHMPAQHVWIDTRRIGAAGYIRFNMFFDPARLMPVFGDSVSRCLSAKCSGMVIDLRGNPGGIGGMSMGMGGWFVSGRNRKLGSMTMQGNKLNFVISPRAETFDGPLAILTDGCSGSTSEIFAAGMQDIGRARIFGTRTAGAALPSVFERLPNGDGFQYATADYVSASGKTLEGAGVTPDEEIRLSKTALAAGRDPVLDRALQWIEEQKKK